MSIQNYHSGHDARNLEVPDKWPESSNSDSTKFLGEEREDIGRNAGNVTLDTKLDALYSVCVML